MQLQRYARTDSAIKFLSRARMWRYMAWMIRHFLKNNNVNQLSDSNLFSDLASRIHTRFQTLRPKWLKIYTVHYFRPENGPNEAPGRATFPPPPTQGGRTWQHNQTYNSSSWQKNGLTMSHGIAWYVDMFVEFCVFLFRSVLCGLWVKLKWSLSFNGLDAVPLYTYKLYSARHAPPMHYTINCST